jgi:hypothetical protein
MGMYRVAGKHKGEGVWHDDGRESPIGPVGVRSDAPEPLTESLPDLEQETRAAASSCGRISGGSYYACTPVEMRQENR